MHGMLTGCVSLSFLIMCIQKCLLPNPSASARLAPSLILLLEHMFSPLLQHGRWCLGEIVAHAMAAPTGLPRAILWSSNSYSVGDGGGVHRTHLIPA